MIKKKRYRIPSSQQLELLQSLLDGGAGCYGYTLMKATGLRQATLYGLLKRLYEEGYLLKESVVVAGRCRIQYGLTSTGLHYAQRALLEAEYERAVSSPNMETP